MRLIGGGLQVDWVVRVVSLNKICLKRSRTNPGRILGLVLQEGNVVNTHQGLELRMNLPCRSPYSSKWSGAAAVNI